MIRSGAGTYAVGRPSGPGSPRNFVKSLISPCFLGISGKSRTFIKNLDTCVKPFLGGFYSMQLFGQVTAQLLTHFLSNCLPSLK